MRIQMIIFDMDGVIFEGRNFWLDLHNIYNTTQEALQLAEEYLYTNRESDYILLSKRTAQSLWKGKHSSYYYDLVKKRKYQPHIHRLFNYIHTKNIKTSIISSGSYDLALRAKEELGIDEIFANRLIVNQSSMLIEDVEVQVPDNKKDRIGLKLMRRFHIIPQNVAFIGDTDSDITLAKNVGLSISYNSSSEKLKQVCKLNLNYGELIKIIGILDEKYILSSQT